MKIFLVTLSLLFYLLLLYPLYVHCAYFCVLVCSLLRSICFVILLGVCCKSSRRAVHVCMSLLFLSYFQKDDVSWAVMNLQLVFGAFYFSLVANFCWSSEFREFRWVKSQFDEFLCGMSPPNKTLTAVGSRGECAIACNQQCPSPCQAINYWNNAKLCEHFHYIPCSYAVQEDCINYKIMISGFCGASSCTDK